MIIINRVVWRFSCDVSMQSQAFSSIALGNYQNPTYKMSLGSASGLQMVDHMRFQYR